MVEPPPSEEKRENKQINIASVTSMNETDLISNITCVILESQEDRKKAKKKKEMVENFTNSLEVEIHKSK